MTLKLKIIIGSSIPLLMLVMLSYISISSMNSMEETGEWVEHTHSVIATATDIEAAAVDMETGMRGYLLAGKEDFLNPYTQGQQRFIKLTGELKKTVNDNPAQVKRLEEIQQNISDWQNDVTEPAIALRREIGNSKTMDDIADLVGEAKGKVFFDKFREQIKQFISTEETLLAKRQRSRGTRNGVGVEHTYKVIQQAMRIEAEAVNMETGMRGYLLAGDENFLDPYKSGSKQFSELTAELKKTVNDNPAQVTLLDNIQKTINAWKENVVESNIELRRVIGDAKSMNDMASLVGQAKGKQYFDKFRDQIATFVGAEEALMGQRQEAAKNTASQAMMTLIMGTLIAIALASIVSLMVLRGISMPLAETPCVTH